MFVLPLGIIQIIIGAFLLNYAHKLSKSLKLNGLQTKSEQPKAAKESSAENEEPVLRIPSELCGCPIAYKYENVDVAGACYQNLDFSKLHLCDYVDFELEPENQYDKNAVKIIANGVQIGYVHKNKLQGMVIDWLERADPIFSAISKIDDENKIIEIVMVFYKNPLNGIDKYEKITTSLIKTSKKDMNGDSRQENYDFQSEDDIVSLEYDDYEENYTVLDSCGNELGELSKSITKKLKEKEITHDFIGIIDEITESDNEKYGAKISIYFKPTT